MNTNKLFFTKDQLEDMIEGVNLLNTVLYGINWKTSKETKNFNRQNISQLIKMTDDAVININEYMAADYHIQLMRKRVVDIAINFISELLKQEENSGVAAIQQWKVLADDSLMFKNDILEIPHLGGTVTKAELEHNEICQPVKEHIEYFLGKIDVIIGTTALEGFKFSDVLKLMTLLNMDAKTLYREMIICISIKIAQQRLFTMEDSVGRRVNISRTQKLLVKHAKHYYDNLRKDIDNEKNVTVKMLVEQITKILD